MLFSDEASYHISGEVNGLNVRIRMSESQFAVFFSAVVTFRILMCSVD